MNSCLYELILKVKLKPSAALWSDSVLCVNPNPVTANVFGNESDALACQNAWLGHMFHYKPVFCFTGTWHAFSPHPFFPPFFLGSLPSEQRKTCRIITLIISSTDTYIRKRPFPTYRWAWNRWVITWPLLHFPTVTYSRLTHLESLVLAHNTACFPAGLNGLETSSGAWGFANTEKQRVCSPLGLSVIHQDLMHPSLGSFCLAPLDFI